MSLPVKFVALMAAILFAGQVVADEDADYTKTMLQGMRTTVIFYTEIDTPTCPFERGIEKKLANTIGILRSKGLSFVAIMNCGVRSRYDAQCYDFRPQFFALFDISIQGSEGSLGSLVQNFEQGLGRASGATFALLPVADGL